jgi:hypothetical protein
VEGHERHHEPLRGRNTDSSPGTFHSTTTESGGSWPASTRQRSYSRETLERVQFDIAAAGSWAGWKCKSGGVADAEELEEQRAHVRGRRRWEGKVPNQCPTRDFKGANTAPHLQHRARRVSETFAHTRAPWRNNRPLT